MSNDKPVRIAILYPGDAAARRATTPENSRFLPILQALARLGVSAEPAVYHDGCADEVGAQLLALDGVLVWVNPIEGGRDRTRLDGLLREVAARGGGVSTHPDVIDRLGTKEVLYETRSLSWGCRDTALYSLHAQRGARPERLSLGEQTARFRPYLGFSTRGEEARRPRQFRPVRDQCKLRGTVSRLGDRSDFTRSAGGGEAGAKMRGENRS